MKCAKYRQHVLKAKSHMTRVQLCGGLTVFMFYVTCPHLHLLVMTEVDLKGAWSL